MKSRTMPVTLVVSSLFVLAASGQARADKIKPMTEAVLQDDNTGSYIVINVTSGEFKFHDCNSSFYMFRSTSSIDFSLCPWEISSI